MNWLTATVEWGEPRNLYTVQSIAKAASETAANATSIRNNHRPNQRIIVPLPPATGLPVKQPHRSSPSGASQSEYRFISQTVVRNAILIEFSVVVWPKGERVSYPALNPYRHSRLVERAALAVAAAVLLAIALPVHAEDNTYVVKTTAGKVRGVARAKGGAEFLGIPYAEPPVGRLRWRAPVAKKKWSGIHDANAFGASCTQPDLGDWNRHDAETGQEDCLYINVIAPASPAKVRCPS